MLSGNEIFYLVLLILGVIGIPLVSILKKDYTAIWSPITFVSVFFFYYCVLGPILALQLNDTELRTIDHRQYFEIGWLTASISFYSILLGFIILPAKSTKSKLSIFLLPQKFRTSGYSIFIIGILLFAVFAGSTFVDKLNFLDTSSGTEGYSGTFSSYFMYSVNLFIAACGFLLVYLLKTKKITPFLIIFIISSILFVKESFRYRLVILVLSSISIYYLYLKKKPNPIYVAIIAILFIFSMGIIEYTRSYGRGLDISRIDEKSNEDIFMGGFNETAVFQANAYLIASINNKEIEQTGFDFVTNAIASPIPRKIWPSKPDGSYWLDVMPQLYGPFSQGQAILFYGEYFLSFGWFGLISLSFLLGMFFKKVWIWFLINKENPLAIIAISIFNGFIYVIISRGYFTQQLTLFMFTVFPVFFVIWLYRKSYLNRGYAHS